MKHPYVYIRYAFLSVIIKTKNLFNTLKKFSILTWVQILLLLAPVLIIIILFFYFKTMIGTPLAWQIFIVLICINLPFLLYSLNKEEINSSLINAYATLMILNFSAFPIFNIFKEFKDYNERKVRYTIGFRAWASEVEISDIEIIYFDEYNNPIRIADDDIYNKKKWEVNLWIYHNYTQNIISDIKKNERNIHLTNCGIALNPKIFENKKVKNFVVKATFKLLKIDSIFVKKFMPGESKYYYSSRNNSGPFF